MVAIKSLVYFAVAATAAVLPRDAAAVLADLKVVNTDTTTLKSDIDAYTGSSSQVLKINSDTNTLNKDINKTTSDANASAVASDADAKSIVTYINGTLEPSIKATLTSLKNKKATFTANGLKATIQSQLKALQSNSAALTTALLNKTPTSQKAAASSVASKVNADVQDAVTYYNS